MKRPDLVHEVVARLASVDGVEEHELPYALHDHVDTSTLAALEAMDDVEWRVSFDVPDHDVAVYSDGRIVVDGSSTSGSSPLDARDG